MNASTAIQPSDLRLGVNVDHVATLRQARGTSYPSVVDAARQAIAAGADSITVHLREDRRHIQDADVETLCASGDVAVNLEMALTDEMIDIALANKPRDCCLVPESREELTTEGGLDVAGQLERVRDGLDKLHGAGINVALFIDPDEAQIDAAAEAGARFIEIHTGAYADATDEGAAERELERIVAAAKRAADHGIEVHAGHGLHVDNVGAIAEIGSIVELNIGHALIARAVFVGLGEAVREMRAAMETARRNLH
ncbi:pyridoxine 5'-phosphate synthase [Salinisphaera hydrothermalis]|uniref:Pyridoxine 5'-phosphate synthase n=1 Tax=Salinisphaera hydrothermalis (strain C41B8) TaxID=1304275 RepID=A0A084IJP8_SALHC|nr:pyridoxine 5'-phosphate synthase [Salinisphaera hydrothermalis]KEZ76932.1 pyridoxine 5'-phosphate synthase [Salinisphaera hydrothermalis C41B8]